MVLRVINYHTIAQRFVRHVQKEIQDDVQCRECIQHVESVCQVVKNKRNRGDQVADSLLEALDNLGVTRTPGQKLFHRQFFCACLPHIYSSDEFENDRERILKRYGFTEIKFEVLVVCPASTFCFIILKIIS
jgi:hypothetical protein